MACKMPCPNCGKMLKELGDESKISDGEYIVYDSLANPKNASGDSRIIECLCCGRAERLIRWQDFELGLIDLPPAGSP